MEQENKQSMEIQVVNGTSIIQNLPETMMVERAGKVKKFKEFIKTDFVDGVDFGQIPGTDKPCLLKPGFEKIQLYLGLTPRYKLLNRDYVANQSKQYKKYNEKTKSNRYI